MTAEESAYAALGLRPGARRADVDEAYRRLIKRYHPDMEGGDPGRAAEINRAYTLLRRHGAALSVRPRHNVPVPVRRPRRPSRWRTGLMMVGAVAIVSAFAVANGDPRRNADRAALAIPFEWPSSSAPASSTTVSPHAQFDDPLQPAVIERAIADAVKFNAEGDLAATAEYSRACYDKLRADPSLTWFDSCAAFDEATVALRGESPFSESGPFDAASVIARQLGGARLLSNDTLEVDSRLQQIRSQVELALLPGLDEPAPQQR